MLPGVRIRLKDDNGNEIEALEEMGEIEIASPSLVHGYIDSASDALLPHTDNADFWWPTGDVGLFRASSSGENHLFIVDRIRDMVKVKVSGRPKTRCGVNPAPWPTLNFSPANLSIGQSSRPWPNRGASDPTRRCRRDRRHRNP